MDKDNRKEASIRQQEQARHANQGNPNDSSHQESVDNRSNQLNPNHEECKKQRKSQQFCPLLIVFRVSYLQAQKAFSLSRLFFLSCKVFDQQKKRRQ